MEEVVEDAPEKKEPKRSGRKVRLGGGSTVRIGKSISVEQQQNDEEQPMVTEEILELKVPGRVSLDFYSRQLYHLVPLLFFRLPVFSY